MGQYFLKTSLAKTLMLLGPWILIMVSLPIIRWTRGDQALVQGIVAGVLVQVVIVILFLLSEWGAYQTIRTCLSVVIIAWMAEWIGSSTGFLFGSYDYSVLLQPQLLRVPILIPMAWLMMLPPSWAIAAAIMGMPGRLIGWRDRLVFAALSALAFTAWDLFLDPQMVNWGFWLWQTPGSYFGIPLSNYLGWFLVSGAISFFIGRVDVPVGPLLIVYLVTWILETIGQLFFWGLPGPALFGFVGMGLMTVWAIQKSVILRRMESRKL